MFTKNFNSLPDSLIEATKKIMTEASNEAPNIQRLTLTQEEASSINELMSIAEEALNEYVVNSEMQKRIETDRDTGNEAMKVAHNAPDRANNALNKLHDRLSNAHPEQKAAKAHLASAIDHLDRMKKASNDKEKTQHLDHARDAYNQAHKVLGAHLQSNAKKLSGQEMRSEEVMPKGMSMKERTAFHMAAAAASKQGKSHFEFGGKKYPATMSKDVATKMNEDSIEEALSPEARKRRDDLKAAVRAAREKYRASKNPAASKPAASKPAKTSSAKDEPEDSDLSSSRHPINRLRQISTSMGGGGNFVYDNGEKHKISRDVARTIVKHYELPTEQGGLKPYQKETIQKEITKSHDHMMKHYNKISGTNEDTYAPDSTPSHPAKGKPMLLEPEKTKKNKKELDEVPIETVKQVRMFNQNEESRKDKLIKYARDAMKKTKNEEQTVLPGAKYAKKIQVPEEVNERQMTDAEMKKREKIVMRLKDKMAGFKERYGKRAKDVMYATATKMAMKEETPKSKTMTGQKANEIEMNPSAPTKEGIGIKSTTT